MRLASAETTVKGYAVGSLAVAPLVPVPLLDLAALAALQLVMVSSLAAAYELKCLPSTKLKSVISTFLGWTIAASISPYLGYLLRGVPLIGSVAGAMSLTALYAASTYATGKVFIQHFESGGTFLTFNPDDVRDYYEKEFQSRLSQAQKP